MPPNRVDDSRCANFSYGNGPTNDPKQDTMSAALLNGPGRKSANSGSTYAHWWTQRPTSVRPHAVSPKSYSYSGAAAMTMRYTGIGSFMRQRVMVLGGLEAVTRASPRRGP